MADVTLLDRSGHHLEVDDDFSGPELDLALWWPHYLPHWASRAGTRARHDLGPGGLTLRIDADQPPWSPEWNGGLRVSNLQTGSFSGPVGSMIGQHRFRPDLIVREAQPELRLYTPMYGLFELTARVTDDPDAMCALWLIGFEDRPERSAEICVMEIFGHDVHPDHARIGMGVHPFGDPAITDDFASVKVAIDARRSHTYAAQWTPERVRFFVDDHLVRTVEQSPAYPMQFMLDIYAFPREGGDDDVPAGSGARFLVERFRGWRPRTGPGATDARRGSPP